MQLFPRSFLLLSAGTMALLAAPYLLADDIVRLSEAEGMKLVQTKVNPEYPATARQMHIVGKVQVEVHIDEDGRVEKAQPIAGNLMLGTAAANAVKRWKFHPPTANGKPTKAITEIGFDFKM